MTDSAARCHRMINIAFTKEELNAIVQTADMAIKTGGLQNARILVPICDRIAVAVAADEAQPKPPADTKNAGAEPTQP